MPTLKVTQELFIAWLALASAPMLVDFAIGWFNEFSGLNYAD